MQLEYIYKKPHESRKTNAFQNIHICINRKVPELSKKIPYRNVIRTDLVF